MRSITQKIKGEQSRGQFQEYKWSVGTLGPSSLKLLPAHKVLVYNESLLLISLCLLIRYCILSYIPVLQVTPVLWCGVSVFFCLTMIFLIESWQYGKFEPRWIPHFLLYFLKTKKFKWNTAKEFCSLESQNP